MQTTKTIMDKCAMHPVLLTFAEPTVEKSYLDYRANNFCNRSNRLPALWCLFRTVVFSKQLIYGELSYSEGFFAVVFWLLPFYTLFLLTLAPRRWVKERLTTLHFCEGLLHGVVSTAVMVNLLGRGDKAALAPYGILASGLLTHCFHLTWYCLPLKLYLLISVWTTVPFFLLLIPQSCAILGNIVKRTTQEKLVDSLDLLLNGEIFYSVEGSCGGQLEPCRTLIIFWHVLMYWAILPFLVYLFERRSRSSFLMNPEVSGVRRQFPVVDNSIHLSSTYVVPSLLFAIPLLWKISGLISYYLFS